MTLIIPGEPVAKGRPRMTRTGHTYTPARTKHYENLIRQCWREQSGEHLTGPLRVEIKAFFQIPKSATKAERKKMAVGKKRPTKKPDLDNIIKTLDALNACAFDDDAQIVEINAAKYYGEPHLEILIEGVEYVSDV